MATKKREGIDAIKGTTGGKRREDRDAIDRTSFDPLSIDAKEVLTVVCLLQSPEELIQLRAVAALEVFGNKHPENLELLCSLKIFEDIYPILSHPDYVARRFALKLIGMLSSLEDFREQMLKMENVLETFADILKRENDAVLQEYASLTLAELSKDYTVASELLKVEDCLATLFLRLISADPDIEKNCLDIIMNLLNDINGIEVFIESPNFEMKTLLNLISSSYPVIQALVIEVLILLTCWCRDTRVLFNFRDSMGTELVLKVLETEEFTDLHGRGLDLMLNVTDSPDMCEYLQSSGCLQRFVRILDNCGESATLEKILGVLARMGQTRKGREALHSVEMEKRFIGYLGIPSENIQESACLGIANLSQNNQSVQKFIEENVVTHLIGMACDREKSIKLRNMAAYALNIMSNANKKPANALVENEDYKGLFTILTDNSNLSAELCQNVIQVFIGISLYDELRTDIISENFLSALLSCLPSNSCVRKDPSLQVDTLECLSEYLVDPKSHLYFNRLGGVDRLLQCLKSKFASVREWAGYLVVIASQDKDFVKEFIKKDGLEWLLKEKNTTYSMPSWQSAIETVFANYLPAKFAYTGRLDFEDITQDGFFVSTNPRLKFLILDYFEEMMVSPVVPFYVANFNTPRAIPIEEESISEEDSLHSNQSPEEPQKSPSKSQNQKETVPNSKLEKIMKGADRNSLGEYTWTGSLLSYPSVEYEEGVVSQGKAELPQLDQCTPDPYLNVYLEELKKEIAKEESPLEDMNWFWIHPKLVCNRARIIAKFVADEMSGVKTNASCNIHLKNAHINELKYFLGTNILPLGLIRIGDYLERAMLFKVLADRIGFPCALVRGLYGRAWIEISVPEINIEDVEESAKEKSNELNLKPEFQGSKETLVSSETVKSESRTTSGTPCTESMAEEEKSVWFPKISLDNFKAFPKEFLQPNSIVDLVIHPGEILRINSFEANEYCGTFLFSMKK